MPSKQHFRRKALSAKPNIWLSKTASLHLICLTRIQEPTLACTELAAAGNSWPSILIWTRRGQSGRLFLHISPTHTKTEYGYEYESEPKLGSEFHVIHVWRGSESKCSELKPTYSQNDFIPGDIFHGKVINGFRRFPGLVVRGSAATHGTRETF